MSPEAFGIGKRIGKFRTFVCSEGVEAQAEKMSLCIKIRK
jgi:hypothetical protein